jgi:hypothetical protein
LAADREWLVAALRRLGPAADVAPVLLAPQNVTWADAIILVLTAEDGTEQSFRPRLVGVPDEPTLKLERRAYAQFQ